LVPFPVSPNIRQNVDGAVGGLQFGYNWQVDRKWVLGVEADIQATAERGRSTTALGSFRLARLDDAIVFSLSNVRSTDLPWFATFRGRAGGLIDPSLLVYGTAGLAVGEVRYASQNTISAQFFGPGNTSTTPVGAPVVVVGTALSDRQTRIGWTAGAGLEKKFTKNFSGKLEYIYLDLGSQTYFGGTADETRVRFNDHILRAGFNYQFNAGPVVAKY
jgi:outer membrane immunogenic protein